jgi:hypothetical protein
LNGDNQVDVADLSILLSCFGTPASGKCAAADYDCDDAVDVGDLSLLLSGFGSCGTAGFAGGDEMSPETEAFLEWARHASIDELLAWNEAWIRSQNPCWHVGAFPPRWIADVRWRAAGTHPTRIPRDRASRKRLG